MSLGEAVKEYRKNRGLTQGELARISGFSGAFICNIENGKHKFTSPETLQRLARALKIKPLELYRAAGIIKEGKTTYEIPQKTPDELLAELETSMPLAIPVVADIHAGPSDAIDYVYWARTKGSKHNLKGLVVHGFCMAPLISEGDVIIVDPDTSPDNGNIIVCFEDDQVWLKKFGEHNDCHIFGVVIGLNRKL